MTLYEQAVLQLAKLAVDYFDHDDRVPVVALARVVALAPQDDAGEWVRELLAYLDETWPVLGVRVREQMAREAE